MKEYVSHKKYVILEASGPFNLYNGFGAGDYVEYNPGRYVIKWDSAKMGKIIVDDSVKVQQTDIEIADVVRVSDNVVTVSNLSEAGVEYVNWEKRITTDNTEWRTALDNLFQAFGISMLEYRAMLVANRDKFIDRAYLLDVSGAIYQPGSFYAGIEKMVWFVDFITTHAVDPTLWVYFYTHDYSIVTYINTDLWDNGTYPASEQSASMPRAFTVRIPKADFARVLNDTFYDIPGR